MLLRFDLPSCDKFSEVQRHSPTTKAISFDLDSCLAAADEVGEQLFAPAFAAIRVVSYLAERGCARSVSRKCLRTATLLRLVFGTAALQELRSSARPTLAVGVRVEATPRRLVWRATPPSPVRGI